MIPILRTGRIAIERSKTNKEALKIEETYFPKIRRIFKTIVREYENKLHFLYEAEKRYGPEIQTIIKSMVTKTYLLGMEYIERATNKPQYVSITTKDLTQIMLQSDEAYRMFWRLVTKYIQVKKNKSITKVGAVIHHNNKRPVSNVTLTDEIFNVFDEEDNNLLDIDTNTELIINGIVATTLAFATFEKFQEFKTIEAEQEQLLMLDEEFIEDVFLEEFTGTGDKYVWASEMDERVCDICSSLEGTEWDIDDPSIVIPRQDSHPRCRCRLLIKINNKIVNK